MTWRRPYRREQKGNAMTFLVKCICGRPGKLRHEKECGPGRLLVLLSLIIATTYIIMSILQRRELRFREVKSLALNCTVKK